MQKTKIKSPLFRYRVGCFVAIWRGFLKSIKIQPSILFCISSVQAQRLREDCWYAIGLNQMLHTAVSSPRWLYTRHWRSFFPPASTHNSHQNASPPCQTAPLSNGRLNFAWPRYPQRSVPAQQPAQTRRIFYCVRCN